MRAAAAHAIPALEPHKATVANILKIVSDVKGVTAIAPIVTTQAVSLSRVLFHNSFYEGRAVTAGLVNARDELRAAGLINDGDAVIPELADLTNALAEPIVLVQIEMTGGQGMTNHGAVIGNEASYVYEGWPGEPESEYVRTGLNTLVWSLARAVGLRDPSANTRPHRRAWDSPHRLEVACRLPTASVADRQMGFGCPTPRSSTRSGPGSRSCGSACPGHCAPRC